MPRPHARTASRSRHPASQRAMRYSRRTCTAAAPSPRVRSSTLGFTPGYVLWIWTSVSCLVSIIMVPHSRFSALKVLCASLTHRSADPGPNSWRSLVSSLRSFALSRVLQSWSHAVRSRFTRASHSRFAAPPRASRPDSSFPFGAK